MIHYSVLIPQRDASQAVSDQLPALCQALDRLILPYEILCVDDASAPRHAEALRTLLGRYPRLRVLAFDQPRGTAAALTAGIAAARGELVVATARDLAAAAYWMPHLIARLAHADFVFAHRQHGWPTASLHVALQAARRITARADIANDEMMLWAARREALANLALARGAFRHLPTLVAQRGFRVMRLSLAANRPPQGALHRAAIGERLLARWLGRRYEPHLACEWPAASTEQPSATLTRVDGGRSRLVPQPATIRADENRPHSA